MDVRVCRRAPELGAAAVSCHYFWLTHARSGREHHWRKTGVLRRGKWGCCVRVDVFDLSESQA